MIKITDEQKNFLNEYIENLEQLLLSDDVNDLLLEIDDVMTANLDADCKPNEICIKLAKVYDEIYTNN